MQTGATVAWDRTAPLRVAGPVIVQKKQEAESQLSASQAPARLAPAAPAAPCRRHCTFPPPTPATASVGSSVPSSGVMCLQVLGLVRLISSYMQALASRTGARQGFRSVQDLGSSQGRSRSRALGHTPSACARWKLTRTPPGTPALPPGCTASAAACSALQLACSRHDMRPPLAGQAQQRHRCRPAWRAKGG